MGQNTVGVAAAVLRDVIQRRFQIAHGMNGEDQRQKLGAKIVGLGKAKELVFTGDFVDAPEALRIGLVNKVVPAAELDDAVNALIDEIMECAPLAVRATKQAAMRGMEMGLGEALFETYPAVVDMMASDDAKEGPLAFSEKRTPNWSGH